MTRANPLVSVVVSCLEVSDLMRRVVRNALGQIKPNRRDSHWPVGGTGWLGHPQAGG